MEKAKINKKRPGLAHFFKKTLIAGEACAQTVNDGYWQVLNTTGSWPPTPRTSHAAMVDQVKASLFCLVHYSLVISVKRGELAYYGFTKNA